MAKLDMTAGSSLFGNIKKAAAEREADIMPIEQKTEWPPEQPHDQQANELQKIGESAPKWQSFDKVNVLFTTEQKEGLDRVAKKIMKYRIKELKGRDDKERITANTIVRALVENFLELENLAEMEVLNSENDVHTWVRKLFK